MGLRCRCLCWTSIPILVPWVSVYHCCILDMVKLWLWSCPQPQYTIIIFPHHTHQTWSIVVMVRSLSIVTVVSSIHTVVHIVKVTDWVENANEWCNFLNFSQMNTHMTNQFPKNLAVSTLHSMHQLYYLLWVWTAHLHWRSDPWFTPSLPVLSEYWHYCDGQLVCPL